MRRGKVTVGRPITVGIPRAFGFYLYYPMWKEFFEALGVRVVASSPTTREILDNGVRETVSDACVPLKLFHGHVQDLADKDVDYLFIPRLVNMARDAVFCPKFLGLPDMIRYSLDDLPPIIDVRIDLRKGKLEALKICYRVGSLFTKNIFKIYDAYNKSISKFGSFKDLVKKGIGLTDAMKILHGKGSETDFKHNGELTFAVLGYPYNIYDPYVSADVIGKLHNMGVNVITTEMIPDEVLNIDSPEFRKEAFWILSHRALKAAHYLFDTKSVDGIIHLTAFGCGPDFMVNKLIELEAKKRTHMPFMSLMIDEQTGDAGVLTRLQAFVDMVKLRKAGEKEGVAWNESSDLSLYGDVSHGYKTAARADG